ncbi:hypothetical protein ScPMuIL_014074 [Solemya velum]
MAKYIDTNVSIQTTEMHTGGEPVRVVASGYPVVEGKTILQKRKYIIENLDEFRKFLMSEPRGHNDMYGVLLVPSDIPGADAAAIFMDNKGYSTMCGHVVISLGRYLVDSGIVPNPVSPETVVKIQCPCGLVVAKTRYKAGRTGTVRFTSVPAFLFAQDVIVEVPGYGSVTLDISYGGAFYAFVDAKHLGLDVHTSSVADLADGASKISDALKSQVKLEHPESDDLAFLYGTILTDGADDITEAPPTNVCVFGDKQVDRSPCGSGTTARVALQYHKGQIKLGQARQFRSLTGAVFTAKAVEEVMCGRFKAVRVEVSGKGHYSGKCTFTLDDEDTIGVSIQTTEMHTGGESVRIIESGYPTVEGKTILDKRRYIRENLDEFRKFVMFEPRGHFDIFGVLLVPPDMPGADAAAIFMHNEGYSTMCGHAVISLGRYLIDSGMVKSPTSPETTLKIQCPCGMVVVSTNYNNRRTGEVRFRSVPAFLFAQDVTVEVPGFGSVMVDISYGGAFFAFVDTRKLGLDIHKSCIADLADAADKITTAWLGVGTRSPHTLANLCQQQFQCA